MSEQFQILLSKVVVIKLRQESLLAENSFNIFRILKAGHEEVGLHSRFLFELLNPKGSHGMGDVFLQLFVKECDLPPLNYDTVNVLREHANIDILIQDNNRAIIIENKIYADDQYEQLKRYFEYTKNSYRQPKLVYLTLNGASPSDHSIGDISEAVMLISYKTHISNWIVACIKESVLRPNLRETLIQYQTLINQLTGNTMNEAEKQEVLNLVAQGDNAEQAVIIARNWNHVRWHTEWNFWTGLLALIEINFEVSAEERFSENAIHKLVHGGQHKNYDYGLRFNIGSIFGTDVVLKIGRGNWEAPMYYGIYNPQGLTTEVINSMSAKIQHLSTIQDDFWIGYKYTSLGIDFEQFDNSITLQLANYTKRSIVIGQLWEEISVFIAETCQALSKYFGTDFIANSKA